MTTGSELANQAVKCLSVEGRDELARLQTWNVSLHCVYTIIKKITLEGNGKSFRGIFKSEVTLCFRSVLPEHREFIYPNQY